MNLNVFIAKSGFCARRKATEHIKGARVTVNGEIVREPWYVVKDGDEVVVAGKKLARERHCYLVMNKPKGVTSTLDDAYAESKIADLIPRRYGRVYPVGRLDKDSRGLIVLTNDGELCYRMTHPKFEVEKEYMICVKGAFDDAKLEAIRHGVMDGGDRLTVSSCIVTRSTKDVSDLKIVVREGKKRHIRRIFETLGFKVLNLKRIRIGDLVLRGLKEGEYREMKKEDAYRLTLGETGAAKAKERRPMKKSLAIVLIMIFAATAVCAEGLDTLIEVGRGQAEIAKDYAAETKAYESVRRAVERGSIKKGQAKGAIMDTYGEPVIMYTRWQDKREQWVYKPASATFDKGPRVDLYFTPDGTLDEVGRRDEVKTAGTGS